MPRPIFDSHLDLAWSACSFNRDLTLSVDEIRRRESHMTDERSRGRSVLSLPELRAAGVACCVGTLLARGARRSRHNPLTSALTSIMRIPPSPTPPRTSNSRGIACSNRRAISA